jgi:hypothetical protein
MVSVRFSEMSGSLRATQRYNPADNILLRMRNHRIQANAAEHIVGLLVAAARR